MADEAKETEAGSLQSELEGALAGLESALGQSAGAAAALRALAPRIAKLTSAVSEIEAAMDRIRGRYDQPESAAAPAAAPSPSEPSAPVSTDQPDEPLTHDQPQISPPEGGSDGDSDLLVRAVEIEAEPGGAGSRCLQVDVTSPTGSLDLSAVDGAINENPAVVDVALLDYDGRRATLKVWLEATADLPGVRDALLTSLTHRVSGDAEPVSESDTDQPAA